MFAPLTAILTLSDAGGDGQQAPAGEWLPAPLAVVVARGRIPVEGATVRFTVATGGGAISATAPVPAPGPQATVDVTTDANGRAQVFWRLGTAPTTRDFASTWEPAIAQRVDVAVLGPAGTPEGQAVSFVAQALNHFNLQIAGGNAQHGRPGEVLELALRARIDDGQRPVANAVVEFSVLNRQDNGTPLNQDTGGSILASARFVSGETWPGGNRHHTVRTFTDAEGVAQVQWTLGTELGLPTQRVEARLLDRAAQPTGQRALFHAQLAIAQETAWRPLVPWLAAVIGGSNHHLQAAVDAIAVRLDQVAAGTTSFDPFSGAQWRSVGGQVQPLGPGTMVPLTQFAAVSFRPDVVRGGTATPHAGIRLYAEIPETGGGVHTVKVLTGNVRIASSGGRWEWTLSSQARGALSKLVTPQAPFHVVPVRITVVPRWLPGAQPTDSSVSHEMLFHLTVGNSPYGPYGLRLLAGIGGNQL